jgi:hypothetical protein
MKLSAILLLAGVTILGYAYSIAPYKDEALFMERYMALSNEQSNEYWKLRGEMLTPKFQLQDYGGTLVALSIGVLLVSRKGWRNFKSPKSRATLIGLAFTAPLLTVGAYAFDLLQGFARGEFPHWADSMAVALMGVPVSLTILLAWSGAHLAFLRGPYHSELLSHALSRQANWWLLAVASIAAVLAALSAAVGQYWYAIPGVVWLYFYISLAASRRSTHDAESGGQRDLAHKATQGRLS